MFSAIISSYRFLYLSLASFIGIGWAIVALSFITSALMAPLMRAVAGIVLREKEYEDVIQPQIDAINRAYASDRDRNLHIQRLYARYAYSPLCAVKKVAPLFVQIPFLLLTYYMLKGTAEINGVSFLFLRDLGTPDGLLTPSINLLPLAMTLINILTVFATPGFTRRDWTQAIGISLLFLVLLYTAPSALLLYWTLNNAITFVRTLVAKNFAGARLIASRFKELPRAVIAFFTPKAFAVATVSFFLLALYFSVFVKCTGNVFDGGIDGGVNRRIAYKAMFYLVTLAAFAAIPLLWRRSRSVRGWLCLSLLVNAGFSIFITVLYCFARPQFLEFLIRFDMYSLEWLLLSVFALPLIFHGLDHSFPADFWRGLKTCAHLLLLPLALSVHYSFSSKVFTLPVESVLLLTLYLLSGCLALYLALVILFRKFFSPEDLFRIAIGVASAVYCFPMIAGEGLLSYTCNLPVRLFLLFLLPFLFIRFRQRAGQVVFLSLFLCAVIFNSFLSHGKDFSLAAKPGVDYHRRVQSVIGDATCVRSNNVYLLVYDSYAHPVLNDALDLGEGGIDVRLRKNGFMIYDAYSLGADTITSMHAMFSIGGVDGETRQSTLAGDNIFDDFLRENGYRTACLLGGYTMPRRGERMPCDFYYPNSSVSVREDLVLLPCILRGTLSQSPNVFNAYTHEDWMAAYYGEMSNRPSSRYFIYAHNHYPAHAPPEVRYRKSDAEEQEAYRKRLKIAREDLLRSVELLENERDSIVIIASDHGPAMMVPASRSDRDERHLLDHHGIFLAIRWPTDYRPVLKLNCLQNVMLEVLIYLTGDKSLAKLENKGRVFSSDSPDETSDCLIERGIMQKGKYKGLMFSEAARRAFDANR